MADMSDEEARALKRERTAAQIERHLRTDRRVFPVVKFTAGLPHVPPCEAAARLDGRCLEHPPLLPLEQCDRARCSCSWRAVTSTELVRLAGES